MYYSVIIKNQFLNTLDYEKYLTRNIESVTAQQKISNSMLNF